MRILAVEDDERLARFLERVLGDAGFTVDRCDAGADAVTRVRSGAYDLVLLDWTIRDLEGATVCRQIRRTGATVPILILTARNQVFEHVLGLDAGADDYLIKPFEVDELLARTHALLRRAGGRGPLALGPLQLDRAGRRAVLDGKALELTERELALLLYLAHRADRVVSKAELRSQVWSLDSDRESNVVEVHVSRVRDKLGRFGWMIETVRGRGYRLRTRLAR